MWRQAEVWRINGGVQFITAIALLIMLVLSGCALGIPKTTELQKIHESYRTEFQQYMQLSVPVPSASPGAVKAGTDQPAFAETLRAIRDYRLKYGENAKEAAHLKVLEGMIYLQSGQVGMARLILPDVQTAGVSLTSGTDTYTRDQLLARAFSFLIDGWEQILNDRTTGIDVRKLETAADNIKNELAQLDSSKLAQPEVDEGAIYLATTAAIFYVWVYQKRSIAEPNSKPQWFGKGQELIGRFLSESERKAAAGTSTAVPSGRLRYISWYGYLAQEAKTQ